jgi:hypothetical protein
MKYVLMILSVIFGSYSCALAQSNSGGTAAGQTSTSPSSVQGTAGTNVGGTSHTNQGNGFGNSATGASTTGMNRTGQPATNSSQADFNALKNDGSMPGSAGGSPTNQRGGSPGTNSRQ